MTSTEAYLDWKFIEPGYFYALFATEAYIVITLFGVLLDRTKDF